MMEGTSGFGGTYDWMSAIGFGGAAETFAGARDEDADGGGAAAHGAGDGGVIQIVQDVQREGFGFPCGQQGDEGEDLRLFLVVRQLFGGGRLRGGYAVVQRSQRGSPYFPASQVIECLAGGDAQQQGGGVGVPSDFVEALPHLKENFLENVVGLVRIPHDAPDAVGHPALERSDQAGEVIHG